MNDGDEAIYIGDDCLFSWGIKARTSDGHSVVDLTTRRAINLPADIRIGSHVWVGEDARFLKGSSIGCNSVVASGSVLTKKIDDRNVIVAGHPGRVVRRNIDWDRQAPVPFNIQAEAEDKKSK